MFIIGVHTINHKELIWRDSERGPPPSTLATSRLPGSTDGQRQRVVKVLDVGVAILRDTSALPKLTPDRHDRGRPAVHAAGAGVRQPGRAGQRPVRPRLCAARGRHRAGAVRGDRGPLVPRSMPRMAPAVSTSVRPRRPTAASVHTGDLGSGGSQRLAFADESCRAAIGSAGLPGGAWSRRS